MAFATWRTPPTHLPPIRQLEVGAVQQLEAADIDVEILDVDVLLVVTAAVIRQHHHADVLLPVVGLCARQVLNLLRWCFEVESRYEVQLKPGGGAGEVTMAMTTTTTTTIIAIIIKKK